jgi:putative inorganic carbon (HCO3(-)) transporter
MLNPPRPLDARRPAWLLRILLAALGVAVAAAAGFQSVAQPSRDVALALFAAAAGAVLLALAYARFEVFLLTVLTIRASVDWTKVPSEVGEPTKSGAMTTAIAVVFLGAAVLWLLVQLKTGRLIPPSLLSLAWLAFLGVALASAVLADQRLVSLAEWGRIATVVVMLLVLQQILGENRNVRPVLVACYVSAIVPLAMSAYQAVTGTGAAEEAARVHGTFAHPNAFGFYLVMLIVTGAALLPHLATAVRPLLLGLLWASAFAIILTYSRGSWIALIVGLLVVGALQSPRAVLLMLGVAAVVAVTVPSVTARLLDLQADSNVAGIEGTSLAWRFDYWSTVIELADESPIVGIGPKMTQYMTASAKVPHNDYLRAYVETGVLGLSAYVAVVAALIHTARRALRWATPGLGQGIAVGFAGCVAAFVLFSVAENVMSQVVVLWYFVAFASVAITVSRRYLVPDSRYSDVATQRPTSSFVRDVRQADRIRW